MSPSGLPLRLSLFIALVTSTSAIGEAPRALPPGTLPQDVRLGPPRTLDSYFPFTPVESKDAWAKRAEQLRR
ncbi:MAG TPA: hypothetical protein VFB66_24565, partial [Tepidisphaeraceae bacterium]|nr:hypothetical protein [Tepidisphaeraceae bacterium]